MRAASSVGRPLTRPVASFVLDARTRTRRPGIPRSGIPSDELSPLAALQYRWDARSRWSQRSQKGVGDQGGIGLTHGPRPWRRIPSAAGVAGIDPANCRGARTAGTSRAPRPCRDKPTGDLPAHRPSTTGDAEAQAGAADEQDPGGAASSRPRRYGSWGERVPTPTLSLFRCRETASTSRSSAAIPGLCRRPRTPSACGMSACSATPSAGCSRCRPVPSGFSFTGYRGRLVIAAIPTTTDQLALEWGRRRCPSPPSESRPRGCP